MWRQALKCAGIPTIPQMAHSEEAYRVEMYMPCKAQAVLVPESRRVISVHRLPSLDSMAQIAAPEFGGQPASLLRMGWADQDSVIVVVWEAADAEVVVTVHLALSGASLQHMLHLTPHDPHQPVSNNENVLKAFATSLYDSIAAIAWQSGGSDIHVALIDLTSGTQRILQRPASRYTRRTRYNEMQDAEMNFAWSPGGKYLMVHEAAEPDGEGQDWTIFTSPAGRFIGPPPSGFHNYDDPPIWSSHHPFCLIGDGTGGGTDAMDLSVVPARRLSYLDRTRSSPYSPYENWGFDPARSVFVPGTRDLVIFRPRGYQKCPIQHWTFDSSLGSTVCHDVLGFNKDLAGAFAVEHMAWQPTLTSAAIYALAERKENGALHLIDAQRHRRLITWPSEQMACMPQGAMSVDNAALAWSPDGKQLAIISRTGTAILSFPS